MLTRTFAVALLAASPSAAFVQPTLSSTLSNTRSTSRLFSSKKEVANGKVKNTKEVTNGEAKVNGGGVTNGEAAPSDQDPYSFIVPILGDLHIDPRKMEDYETGRTQMLSLIKDAKSKV